MSQQIDEIRRRIELRKKEGKGMAKDREGRGDSHLWREDEPNPALKGQYDSSETKMDYTSTSPKTRRPTSKWHLLIMQMFGAFTLVSLVYVMKHSPYPMLNKMYVSFENVYLEEVNTAVLNEWYTQKFGNPLTFLPFTESEGAYVSTETTWRAPVRGTVLSQFDVSKRGVWVETVPGEIVYSTKKGNVTFIGEKEGIGLAVAIAHPDGRTSWYGNLATVDVQMYRKVNAHAVIGTVQETEGKGAFYFAVDADGKWTDPETIVEFRE
ncbi:MAG: peptidoglycan DD-metalloendopeptidase family protein [Bacilli bacterium]